MRRFSALLFSLAFVVLLGLTGCGSDAGTPVFGDPASITVTPTSSSLSLGDVENVNAIVKDSKGTNLFISGGVASSNVTFTSSNTAILDVATNGLLCAGKWDSTTTPIVCTAGQAGQATITVKAGNVTSTPVNFFVHQPVDRITVSNAPPDESTCISQGATQQLTATAFSNGQDITSSVGPITITPTVAEVVSIDTNGLATANNPGKSGIVADVGTFRSASIPFVVCPITSIDIHVKGATDTSVALDPAGTATLSADLKDKNGTTILITKATSSSTTSALTWSTTSPAATVTGLTPVKADVTSTTTNDATVTGSRAGTTSIVASCTPPICNTGLSPVYSNVVTEKTSGTTSSTVFVTGTDTTSLIPIPTSTNTPGTAITLSNQPNSILVGPDGARLLMGSSGGLMVVDANALTFTGTIATVTGKVLAIGPDGRTAVVSDTSKGQVFVGDVTGSSFQVFPISGVTAAAFSRDGFHLYVASSNAVSVLTTGAAIKRFAFGATDVTSNVSGSMAYFANGTVRVIASCNLATLPNVTGATNATLIKALAGGSQVLTAGVNTLEVIDATADNSTCAPSAPNTATSVGVTGTPSQIIPTSDGSRAFITNDTANIVTYSATDKSASTIALTGSPAASFTGGVTLDGTQLYVGVQGAANSTPTVHRVDLATNADTQQITASTTSFTPNLVAVRP